MVWHNLLRKSPSNESRDRDETRSARCLRRKRQNAKGTARIAPTVAELLSSEIAKINCFPISLSTGSSPCHSGLRPLYLFISHSLSLFLLSLSPFALLSPTKTSPCSFTPTLLAEMRCSLMPSPCMSSAEEHPAHQPN